MLFRPEAFTICGARLSTGSRQAHLQKFFGRLPAFTCTPNNCRSSFYMQGMEIPKVMAFAFLRNEQLNSGS